MKITTFAKKLSWHEKGKKQVNIAQITELLSKANKMLNGVLYSAIGLKK